MRDDPEAADPLIRPLLAEAFEVLPGRADEGLVLVCDHASNRLPPEYGTLGLCPSELQRHIAYDIGAREVTARLSAALGVPAVLSRFSRLLIDPNRGLDDPTLVMRLSDGAVVPGNRRLSPEEKETRVARYYEPYHRAISQVIARAAGRGRPPAILSIHSFTDVWKGRPRPWHAGVLWDTDGRLARPLLEALRAEPDLAVGDNEPYSGHLEGDTLWRHGLGGGLPHALVEIRQDLISGAAGQDGWALLLARLLGPCLDGARAKEAGT